MIDRWGHTCIRDWSVLQYCRYSTSAHRTDARMYLECNYNYSLAINEVQGQKLHAYIAGGDKYVLGRQLAFCASEQRAMMGIRVRKAWR